MDRPEIPTTILIINHLVDLQQELNLIVTIAGGCWLVFDIYLSLKKRYKNNEIHGKFYDFLFKK